jgi:hypothetical protein
MNNNDTPMDRYYRMKGEEKRQAQYKLMRAGNCKHYTQKGDGSEWCKYGHMDFRGEHYVRVEPLTPCPQDFRDCPLSKQGGEK